MGIVVVVAHASQKGQNRDGSGEGLILAGINCSGVKITAVAPAEASDEEEEEEDEKRMEVKREMTRFRRA